MESEQISPPFKFGFKVVKREEFVVTGDQVYLECKEENHNKFYNIQIMDLDNNIRNGRIVVRHTYGVIGGRIGGTKDKVFNNSTEAQDYVMRKVKLQIKKGYKIVPQKKK